MRRFVSLFILNLFIIALARFPAAAQTRIGTLMLHGGEVLENVEILQEKENRIQIRKGGIKSWLPRAKIDKLEYLVELPTRTGPAERERWKNLWKPKKCDLSNVQTIVEDGKKWNNVSTRYFEFHFTETSNRKKVRQLASAMDNLYMFLHERTGRDIPYPIKAYLIPEQYGRSRCDFQTMSIYTGDEGDFEFNLTSYMHEITHLFNKGRVQNWWSGEFMCIYNQERMRLGEEAARRFFRKAAERDTTRWDRVAEIDRSQLTGKKWNNRLFLGAAIHYFVEETYGLEKLKEFWDLNSQPGSRMEIGSIITAVFGKDIDEMEREYRLFYSLQALPLMTTNRPGKQEHSLLSIVQELSSKKYKGRKAGDPACESAARYIADLFRDCGLTVAGNRESFFQTVTLPYSEFSNSVFRLEDGNAFTVYRDYRPVCGNKGELISGRIVFVGYGLSESDYDDYKSTNLKGAIALALRGAPKKKYRRDFSSKVAAAARHDAAGLLIVDTSNTGRPFDLDQKVVNPSAHGIPALHISREIGNQILAQRSLSMDKLETQIGASKKPRSFDTGMNAEMSVSMMYKPDARSSNVLGVLPGDRDTDPKDYYVVCAHYDGQGRDEKGGFFPSANDNASGVAATVGVARSLQPIAPDLDFSVIFAAWTGEEIGLRGSSHFCRHPTVPLNQIRGVINLDMVGSGSGRKTFVQTPDKDNRLYLAATRAAGNMRINLNPIVRVNPGSDAHVFSKRKIPTLFFLTGEAHNHSASDSYDRIDLAIMKNVVNLTTQTLTDGMTPAPLRRSARRAVGKTRPGPFESGQAIPPDTSTIIVEEGAGFGEIVIANPECTREFIKSRLGPPDQEMQNWLNYKSSLGLDFLVSDREFPLKEIRLNPGFQGTLSSDISMSSSMDDVFVAYGLPKKEENVYDIREHYKNRILYRMGNTNRIFYNDRGLLFWFDGDRIKQIVVFQKGRP